MEVWVMVQNLLRSCVHSTTWNSRICKFNIEKQVKQDEEVTIQDDGSFDRELYIVILRTWFPLFKTCSNNTNHLKPVVDDLHIKAVLKLIFKNPTSNLYTKALVLFWINGIWGWIYPPCSLFFTLSLKFYWLNFKIIVMDLVVVGKVGK